MKVAPPLEQKGHHTKWNQNQQHFDRSQPQWIDIGLEGAIREPFASWLFVQYRLHNASVTQYNRLSQTLLRRSSTCNSAISSLRCRQSMHDLHQFYINGKWVDPVRAHVARI